MRVQYDATDSSYTLTLNDGPGVTRRTWVFRPADIQPSFDPNVTIYQAVDNSGLTPATETLFLTKNNASTYTYVGGGVWTRIQRGSLANTTTRADAFAYGVETPDAALPRTGSASFDVTLAGALTNSGSFAFASPDGSISYVAGLSGTGTLNAAFGTGLITLSGTAGTFNPFTGASFGSAQPFGGTATIAASTNNFSGTFTYGSGTVYNGGWLGRFYGPAAQEVGASFHASNGNITTPAAATGVILGKRSAAPTGATYGGFGGWTGSPGSVAPAGIPVPAGQPRVEPAVPPEMQDGRRQVPRDRD
jgi:hypothetical protein